MNNDFNKKEDLTLFFCDIYGTIDGGLTEEDCVVFAELLEKLELKIIVIIYILECLQLNTQMWLTCMSLDFLDILKIE